MRIARLAAISVLMFHSLMSFGVCLDKDGKSGWHQPVKDEVEDSFAIVTGVPIKITNLSEDKTDPGGYTATIYNVQISKTVRGILAGQIVVRSENDSGRFSMDIQKKYLLFLQKKSDGALFVSSCGNSGLIFERQSVLHELGTYGYDSVR
jgi:hypothetical protein